MKIWQKKKFSFWPLAHDFCLLVALVIGEVLETAVRRQSFYCQIGMSWKAKSVRKCGVGSQSMEAPKMALRGFSDGTVPFWLTNSWCGVDWLICSWWPKPVEGGHEKKCVGAKWRKAVGGASSFPWLYLRLGSTRMEECKKAKRLRAQPNGRKWAALTLTLISMKMERAIFGYCAKQGSTGWIS